MVSTLKDFYSLFSHIAVNFKLKVDVYSPHDIYENNFYKHESAYDKNDTFVGDAEYLFNNSTTTIVHLDSYIIISAVTKTKHVGSSKIYMMIDSDNISSKIRSFSWYYD